MVQLVCSGRAFGAGRINKLLKRYLKIKLYGGGQWSRMLCPLLLLDPLQGIRPPAATIFMLPVSNALPLLMSGGELSFANTFKTSMYEITHKSPVFQIAELPLPLEL